MLQRGMDTLLLACTHYPLLIPRLRQLLGDKVRLVDSATTCAHHLEKELTRLDLLAPPGGTGQLDLWLTDLSEQFEILATRFLESPLPRIRRATL
jgi:glutamate racemase